MFFESKSRTSLIQDYRKRSVYISIILGILDPMKLLLKLASGAPQETPYQYPNPHYPICLRHS